MIIRSLRVNHIENPLGYKMDKPFLSWTAESETGKKQIAARVEISLSETFDSLEFDSGLRADISPLGYVPELTLQPRTRYFWRVEVVADDGDRAVSEPAWFETGKCGEPWAAQWIQSPYDKDVHSILGTTVTLPAAPVRAPAEPPKPAAAPATELDERIRAFLSGLLAHMGVEAEVCIGPKEDGSVLVTLDGPKLGALIGHRGETLDAIQQLTNYTVNRGRAHRVRIHIDAENYRAKREDSLKRLATKVAAKVVKYRRNITLEPMNAYERHVIHETLQDYPDVITYSTGMEPNRRTVVAFSRGRHQY